LELVADRLWLVNKGTVTPYEGDLESYRAELLASDKPAPKPKAEKPKKPSRDAILGLRAEVRKCEERVEKLSDMRERLDAKLADPTLYETGKPEEIAQWQKKHAELVEAMDRAESLWMDALEKLEGAETA
jgi:ATP-binding cassette subfamily F protein 3